MARRRFSVHRLAGREIEHERRFYQRKAQLGAALIGAVEEALKRMSEHPDRFTLVANVDDVVVRSVRLKRFPFRLYFADEGDTLRVYALAHGRRRPGYWTRRVGS